MLALRANGEEGLVGDVVWVLLAGVWVTIPRGFVRLAWEHGAHDVEHGAHDVELGAHDEGLCLQGAR